MAALALPRALVAMCPQESVIAKVDIGILYKRAQRRRAIRDT
jgi:hypothetical protein